MASEIDHPTWIDSSIDFPSLGDHFGDHFRTILGSEFGSKSLWDRSWLQIHCSRNSSLEILNLGLGNGPQMVHKWSPDGPQVVPKRSQEGPEAVWEASGRPSGERVG